jgi:hypothetical protein
MNGSRAECGAPRQCYETLGWCRMSTKLQPVGLVWGIVRPGLPFTKLGVSAKIASTNTTSSTRPWVCPCIACVAFYRPPTLDRVLGIRSKVVMLILAPCCGRVEVCSRPTRWQGPRLRPLPQVALSDDILLAWMGQSRLRGPPSHCLVAGCVIAALSSNRLPQREVHVRAGAGRGIGWSCMCPGRRKPQRHVVHKDVMVFMRHRW